MSYEKLDEREKMKEPQPIIDFKYYEPKRPSTAPKQKEFMMQPIYPQPVYYPQHPTSFNPMPQLPPLFGNEMPQQVIHNVNITTSGPNIDHAQIAMIYEDSLPITKFATHSVALYDRLNLYQFIRSTVLKGRDGQDTSFDGSTSSLLTKLKIGDINPYRTDVSNNLYYDLPNDYIIYRSCYPIRLLAETSSTQCSKKSCAINIRIYKMDYGAIKALEEKNNKKTIKYPQLRDIGFYEYVKAENLKKKICPNFVLMFGYFISNAINIDFRKINIIRGMKDLKQLKYHDLNPDKTYQDEPGMFDDTYDEIQHMEIPKTLRTIERNDKFYENHGLVVLTESGTHSVISWTTPIYQPLQQNIQTMIYRGSHTEDEWLNVIFQIMAGLYVMIIKEICISDMDLKKNIFIKDIDNTGIVKTYWKYVIDNVEYYVPNMGFIVLIDSDYNYVSEETTVFKSRKQDKIKCAKYFNENIEFNEYKTMILNIVDPNNYNHNKMIKLHDTIKNILNDLHRNFQKCTTISDLKKNFKILFALHMSKYLNSRIGSTITEQETTSNGIHTSDSTGLALQNTQIVAIVHKQGDDCIIIKKNNGKYKEEPVDINTLNKITIPLVQPPQFGEPIRNDENLLEIYIINDDEPSTDEVVVADLSHEHTKYSGVTSLLAPSIGSSLPSRALSGLSSLATSL